MCIPQTSKLHVLFSWTQKYYISKLGVAKRLNSGQEWLNQEWSESVVLAYSLLRYWFLKSVLTVSLFPYLVAGCNEYSLGP